MMHERLQLEQHDQAKKQIEVASQVVNRLVNVPGMSVDEIGTAQAAIEQTLPQMPIMTPDLKLSVAALDAATLQLNLAKECGLVEPDLYEKLRLALDVQREISLDRSLNYIQRLPRRKDSKVDLLHDDFNQFTMAKERGLVESQLYKKLRVALNAQREISLNRPPTFREQLSANLNKINQTWGYLKFDDKVSVGLDLGASVSFAVIAGISLANADISRAICGGFVCVLALVFASAKYKWNSGKS